VPVLVTLARGAPSMSVTAPAAEVEMSKQNTSQAPGRLVSAGRVTRAKPPTGADQRSILYALAAPALREFLRAGQT
jgi:hypothetical protein